MAFRSTQTVWINRLTTILFIGLIISLCMFILRRKQVVRGVVVQKPEIPYKPHEDLSADDIFYRTTMMSFLWPSSTISTATTTSTGITETTRLAPVIQNVTIKPKYPKKIPKKETQINSEGIVNNKEEKDKEINNPNIEIDMPNGKPEVKNKIEEKNKLKTTNQKISSVLKQTTNEVKPKTEIGPDSKTKESMQNESQPDSIVKLENGKRLDPKSETQRKKDQVINTETEPENVKELQQKTPKSTDDKKEQILNPVNKHNDQNGFDSKPKISKIEKPKDLKSKLTQETKKATLQEKQQYLKPNLNKEGQSGSSEQAHKRTQNLQVKSK